MEILKHRKKRGGGFELYIKYEGTTLDKNGNHVTQKDWGDLCDIWNDCQSFVDDGEEEYNFVIKYLAIKSEKGGIDELIEETSKLANQDVTKYFPSIIGEKKEDDEDDQDILECTANHEDYTAGVYTPIDQVYYFKHNQKWHGLQCILCKNVVFGNLEGQVRPTVKKPVHVCEVYNREKCNCQKMICDECFKCKQRGK